MEREKKREEEGEAVVMVAVEDGKIDGREEGDRDAVETPPPPPDLPEEEREKDGDGDGDAAGSGGRNASPAGEEEKEEEGERRERRKRGKGGYAAHRGGKSATADMRYTAYGESRPEKKGGGTVPALREQKPAAPQGVNPQRGGGGDNPFASLEPPSGNAVRCRRATNG